MMNEMTVEYIFGGICKGYCGHRWESSCLEGNDPYEQACPVCQEIDTYKIFIKQLVSLVHDAVHSKPNDEQIKRLHKELRTIEKSFKIYESIKGNEL